MSSLKGAALDNCWGFVNGMVTPIGCPGKHQWIMYNGHKRVNGLKFQSVVAPNGLIANIFGPVGEYAVCVGILYILFFNEQQDYCVHNQGVTLK